MSRRHQSAVFMRQTFAKQGPPRPVAKRWRRRGRTRQRGLPLVVNAFSRKRDFIQRHRRNSGTNPPPQLVVESDPPHPGQRQTRQVPRPAKSRAQCPAGVGRVPKLPARAEDRWLVECGNFGAPVKGRRMFAVRRTFSKPTRAGLRQRCFVRGRSTRGKRVGGTIGGGSAACQLLSFCAALSAPARGSK